MADAERLNIGQIITGQGQQRDAIHVAVVPMTVGATRYGYLYRSERVKLQRGSIDKIVRFDDENDDESKCIGIIDPYLGDDAGVREGETVWVFLKPGTITSLRHDWTHPQLPHEAPPSTPESNLTREQIARWTELRLEGRVTKQSDQWMQEYCDRIDEDVADIMEAANDAVHHGGYYSKGGKFEGMSLPEEFWDHYYVLTGENVPEKERHSFFSCSC